MLTAIDEDRTQVTKRPASGAVSISPSSSTYIPASERSVEETPTAVHADIDQEFDSSVETDVLHKVRITPADPYPIPGQTFLGFEIQSELGRGSMGRVFLATQLAMASRTVVLKVGQHLSSECEKLAKLQHPNVVPVYSFHQDGNLQCVCMPYRGTITLGHLADQLKSQNLETLNGKALTTVISVCRESRKKLNPTIAEFEIKEIVDQKKVDLPKPSSTNTAITPLLGMQKLNYIDAVLSLIRQVADGLRFAHMARIVHADLKPANILISDDGVPQLIDFGIAYDKSNHNADIMIGGTRPYMSPEQLTSFLHEKREYDERSDLYAVGVILYELLTGRLPFTSINENSTEAIETDYKNRFSPPKSPRSLNSRIPMAVESIINKCLTVDVTKRYQTAGQLIEDLDCQIKRRPLITAGNPSKRELAVKWIARNRRTLIATGLVTIFGGTVVQMFQWDKRRRDQIALLNANYAGESFTAALRDAEFLFGLSANDPDYRERAWDLGRRALDHFGAWNDPLWFEKREFQSLPTEKLASYRQQCAGLMLLLANSRSEQASRSTDATAKEQFLQQAFSWNVRAELTHPAPTGSRAVWAQRSYLTRLKGDHAESERLARRADPIPRSPADAVLEGRQLLTEGRMQAALPLFTEASQGDPRNFWAKFYSGVGHQYLGQDLDAVKDYDICESMQLGFFGTHFNRGQSLMRVGRASDAEVDFNRAIELRANWPDAFFQRAISRELQKNFEGAVEDLNRALDLGYTPTSVYLLRSRVYGRMNEKKASDADLAKALAIVPTDERGWLARAQARIFNNPAAALADYDEALKINPRQTTALQGKAHLLGNANRNEDSAKALTQLISINPDSPDAWSGRGVLRARLNDRDGAIADAREALRITERAATKYQVAGIYATTSKTHPEDRREAFRLLESALREGFGFEYLKDDPELDPIRKDPEFAKLIEAAKTYRNSLKKPN